MRFSLMLKGPTRKRADADDTETAHRLAHLVRVTDEHRMRSSARYGERSAAKGRQTYYL
jgi:hypothetical protein